MRIKVTFSLDKERIKRFRKHCESKFMKVSNRLEFLMEEDMKDTLEALR